MDRLYQVARLTHEKKKEKARQMHNEECTFMPTFYTRNY